MNSKQQQITLALSIWFLLLSVICGAAAAGPKAAVAHPVRPQRGAPQDRAGLAAYFEEEAIRLLRQGRTGTNLARQAQSRSCRLKLAPVPTRVLGSAELAQQIEMGVVMVGRVVRIGKTERLADAASGFFISESGAVATCRHLLEVKGLIGLVVMTRDGRVCPVRQVLAADPLNDVIILQVDGEGFTALPVAPKARQGQPVWVLSHPTDRLLADGLPYTLTTGIVSGYQIRLLGGAPRDGLSPQSERTLMNITAEFANGSSGAPACNACGAVVGIAALTQGIYEDGPNGPHPCPLMVVRSCTPSAALLELIQPQ